MRLAQCQATNRQDLNPVLSVFQNFPPSSNFPVNEFGRVREGGGHCWVNQSWGGPPWWEDVLEAKRVAARCEMSVGRISRQIWLALRQWEQEERQVGTRWRVIWNVRLRSLLRSLRSRETIYREVWCAAGGRLGSLEAAASRAAPEP